MGHTAHKSILIIIYVEIEQYIMECEEYKRPLDIGPPYSRETPLDERLCVVYIVYPFICTAKVGF